MKSLIMYLCDTSTCQGGYNNHTVDDIHWYSLHAYKSFRDILACMHTPLVYCNIRFSNGSQEEVCILCNFLQSILDDILIKTSLC